MNTAWITLLSIMFVMFGQSAGKEKKWIIPVLMPEDNVCIQQALKLGFQDINGTRLKSDNPSNYYTLTPEFYTAGRNYAKLIELVNAIHYFVVSPNIGEMVKKLTIGPPYSEQILLYSEFVQILPNIQVDYNAIPEPYSGNIELRFQTPPSISGLFHASRTFMLNMNWTHAILVYDFSNSRYRHSVNNFEEILQDPDGASNQTIKVVYKARVRSELSDTRTDTLKRLPHLDSRVAFLLLGVSGARQIFCQAYHLELQRSGFVWIMLEKLPDGWMTDKYDSVDTVTGERKREIDCTVEQLFSVARNIIYITRGGVRRDNAITTNGHTASNFQLRLKKAVDEGEYEQCIDDAAYAYDSVWLSVKILEAALTIPRFDAGFSYISGTLMIPHIRKVFPAVKFEGVTGLLSFHYDKTFFRQARAGSQWIYSVRDAGKPVWVGSYETTSKRLSLVDNAVQLLFGSSTIPSDGAHYIYTEYKFPNGYIIAIWTLACIGIFATLALSCLISVCRRNTTTEQVRQRGLQFIDVVMIVGCLVCFVSLIIYGLDTRFLTRAKYKDGCYGFLSTLTIGFTLTFGALFAKTWYKYKLYNAPSAQKELSEWFMFFLIAFFLLVDIILLITWSETSPFGYIVSNPVNKSLSFAISIEETVRCDGAFQKQFLIGLYCYKCAILLFGLFLAWQTTSHAHKKFARTKGDNFAIINTVVVSITGVVCVTLLEDTAHRHALYVIVTICVILCVVTMEMVVFVPKIKSILYPFGSDNSSQGSTDQENNKHSFTKFTLELRRRVTGKNAHSKYPSVSSMATSQISISTATSSLDSRKNILPGSDHHQHSNNTENNRQGSFVTESSSQAGSLVSYNPNFSSPSGNATILEVSGEEPMNDIIATHPASAEVEEADEEKESTDDIVTSNVNEAFNNDEKEEHKENNHTTTVTDDKIQENGSANLTVAT